MSGGGPFLSVIVPAHAARAVLPDTLAALAGSELPRERWELTVVDDASTDDTAAVAAEYADSVVRLPGSPHGPAYARNRGAEASRGVVLVFLDADVRVDPAALARIASAFERDPDLGAVFGSYDDDPPAPGVVSRYRNLLHHYHHHRGAGPAETFWAGLGAVRAEVFAEVGGFDEWHYGRPQIEDIELGRRIRRAGYRIVLDPRIQGAHLKRWTLRNVLETDLLHRGIPWMRLMLCEGGGGGTLNVKPKERVCVALAGLGVVIVGAAALLRSPWPLLGIAVVTALVVLLNHDFYRFMYEGRGAAFTVAVVPLHLLYYLVSGLSVVLGYAAHFLLGEPAPAGQGEPSTDEAPPWPPPPKRTPSIWDLRAPVATLADEPLELRRPSQR